MPDEQLDFLNKLDQQPKAKVEEVEVDERSIAREVFIKMFEGKSVEEEVEKILTERNIDMSHSAEICRLVNNTLIDKGEPDTNH
jgi:hypothetical protein